jgi:hypothetical protein
MAENYGNINIDASDPKGVSDGMIVVLTLIGTDQQTIPVRSAELLNFIKTFISVVTSNEHARLNFVCHQISSV